jgi:arabinofuranosyltransferase
MANLRSETTIDQHFLARSGARIKEEGESVVFRGGIGLAGYFAGPQVHIVDSLALSDVLLARLPVGNPNYWRIGHFKRVNPAGFKDSIRSGENVIEDPQLASLYDIFQSITQGSLVDVQRLTAIWQVNTGQYAHLLDADGYIFDQIRPLALEEICGHVGEKLEEDGPCISNVPHQGFIVDFQEKRHDSSVEFAMDGNYDYEFFFLDSEAIIGNVFDKAVGSINNELVLRKIDVPEDVSLNGFDALWMRPIFIGLDPENPRMVGQITLR